MSETTTVQTFEVNRSNWQQTRTIEETFDGVLQDDEVLLAIDRFALTANNISYCVSGDMLGYWRFFPAQEGWGRIPAMGFADVVASNCPGIAVGERVWGFLPMATHLKIKAGSVTKHGFKDVSSHRDGLAPFYANFDRVAAAPDNDPAVEDLTMLLRGLFATSWLVEDFMFDNNHFGASQYLITSASSKTSIALAFAVRERGLLQAVGLTSAGNKSFVEGLGCYDRVITYDEIGALDATVPSVVVDMAGSDKTLADIHHHFGDQLRFSSKVGATHYEEMTGGLEGSGEALPGAEPVFFFAPAQIEQRNADWGAGEVMKRLSQSLVKFLGFGAQILTVRRQRGAQAMADSYLQMLAGNADASVGYVMSLRD